MPETPFLWRCPFCDQNATITEDNYIWEDVNANLETSVGDIRSVSEFTVCPNPDCRLFSFTIGLDRLEQSEILGVRNREWIPIDVWKLVPASGAKVFPSYIPQAVRDDYKEACLILQGSPKASATLARRALQGMIRDFWGVQKPRLYDEIEAIKDKVDSLTWAAIDGVRTIGNIGAHMEKDINLIVDVEPEEADKLIWLIETLVNDWYIDKHEKEQRLAEIANVAKEKQRERRNDTSKA